MSEIKLNDDDVVCIEASQNFTKTTTSKVKEVKYSMMVDWLKGLSHWVDKGVSGSVLLAEGGGWQTGKFRLRIEFTPDKPPESSSPLDQVLSELTVNNNE